MTIVHISMFRHVLTFDSKAIDKHESWYKNKETKCKM
jgi:hypothetical protein